VGVAEGVEVADGVEVATAVAVALAMAVADFVALSVDDACAVRSRCAAETWESERNSLATTAPISAASTSEVAMVARNDTRWSISIIRRPSWLS